MAGNAIRSPNISGMGFSLAAVDTYPQNQVISITLNYADRRFTGRGTVRSAKPLSDGRQGTASAA